ncbi:MAG: RHS repeat-associated core domain-containing protein [Byssovorax sp.]
MPTSPVPDMAAPPGMCPGVAVLGGAGGAGDGSGTGSGGSGGSGNGGGAGGDGAGGDGKSADGAPDPGKPDCGTASHPVDVVTGRAFTHPLLDLALPGPLPLRFQRICSSTFAERDVGLGYGWAHTLGWEIEIDLVAREASVWTDQGTRVRFPLPREGTEQLGPWGFLLRREADGFQLDVDDGVVRRFEAADDRKRRYRLTSIEDDNHNRISLRYEGSRLAEVTDSAGRAVRFKGTKEGRIAAIEAQNAVSQGQWVAFATYAYDDRGRLVSVTDADGHVAQYAYDEAHRLTADTDRTRLCFHFRYDRQGRCVESWGDYPGRRDPSLADDLPKMLGDGETKAKGIHHCRFDYMPGYYTEVADSTQVRRFFGNKHGTLDKRVEGSAITEATYREDGHILSRTGPNGGVTSFERDVRGRLLARKDPLGRVTRFEREGNGLPVKVTDPAGGVTQIERDPRGNAVMVVDALGGVTTYRVDERGLVTEEVSPTGARTAYAYDAHGNLVTATLPNGGIYRFVHDALGRLLSRVDPLGGETRYVHSARGDLVSVRDAAGQVTRYSYDGEGHLTQVIDPKGQITRLTWGGYHKLCAREDANGHEVKLRYNLEGELVEVHNEEGEVHRLSYSASGLLTGETTFDGRELRYRYDEGGQVTRFQNGLGEHVDLGYDLAGQLVKRTLTDDGSEEFAYDLLGNLIEAKGPAGQFSFARDALGRVVREAQIVGGSACWTEVGYDPAGQRVSRKTSLGHTEVIRRDALGSRTRTALDGAHLVDHQVDMLGRETGRALPGGGWMQHGYDALGRVERRRAGMAAGTAVDTAYRYDEAGELVESWDKTRGKTRYAYDPIGQLLSMVPEKAQAELFRYDPRGNLHEAGEGAEARVYGKGNRLLRKGDTEYLWDKDGRLREKRTRKPGSEGEEIWRYAWDGAGLLREVTGPEGLKVAFKYDPFARRVSKQVLRDRVEVSQTRFVWDGDVLVHEIERRADAAGDPVVSIKTYCFEDDGFAPVAHREGEEWFHYVNDPIGTPERLVDGRGEVAGELARKAWGETEERGRARTAIRFQGQYEDRETGLSYNRRRYYDPALGRFLSTDPLGIAGTLNAYYYVKNPLGWIDPFGEIFERKYSRYEVRRMLEQSEGRAPVPGNPVGHAQSMHGSIGDSALQARADADGNRRSASRSCAQQARATQEALNSPQGQAALAQLDANPGQPFAKFTAPVASVARVATPGGAGPTDQASSSMFVKVFRPPSGSGLPHIQTSFPLS